MLERLVSPAGKDVLDVGCGNGALVRALSANGARTTGIEISEDRLAEALARDPDRAARYLVGRAEGLPIADASVDVVVFMRALHHVPVDQLPAALLEARRVLRPDGAVYVAEPIPEGSFFRLTCLVDDERSALRAAQDALDRAGEAGFSRIVTSDYATEASCAGVAAFRALMVSVDPDRARVFAEREREIGAAFEDLGEPGTAPEERRFHHRTRVAVLRPAAGASSEPPAGDAAQ